MSEPVFDDSVQQALRGIVDRVTQPTLLSDQLVSLAKNQGELVRLLAHMNDVHSNLSQRLIELEAQQNEMLDLLQNRRKRKKALLP